MTVLDIKNQLVTHFLRRDTFDPVRDANEITYDKDTANFREELVRAALQELEAQGFVRKLTQSDSAKDIWILVQPIGSYAQQVTLSPIIAEVLANIINFHNELDNIDFRVDKTKIDEGTIARMIQIVSEYDDEAFAENEEGEEEEEK